MIRGLASKKGDSSMAAMGLTAPGRWIFFAGSIGWSRPRRVIAKAAHLEKGANSRFGVTSLAPAAWAARALYEELDCARGEMEKRLKEQLTLFADRTSTACLRSKQIRLDFSSAADLLLHALRRRGLHGTALAQAPGATIRLKGLKIGALIRRTVRKLWGLLAGGYPYAELLARVYAVLQALPLRGGQAAARRRKISTTRSVRAAADKGLPLSGPGLNKSPNRPAPTLSSSKSQSPSPIRTRNYFSGNLVRKAG
jgi:hypothetical protein